MHQCCSVYGLTRRSPIEHETIGHANDVPERLERSRKTYSKGLHKPTSKDEEEEEEQTIHSTNTSRLDLTAQEQGPGHTKRDVKQVTAPFIGHPPSSLHGRATNHSNRKIFSSCCSIVLLSFVLFHSTVLHSLSILPISSFPMQLPVRCGF